MIKCHVLRNRWSDWLNFMLPGTYAHVSWEHCSLIKLYLATTFQNMITLLHSLQKHSGLKVYAEKLSSFTMQSSLLEFLYDVNVPMRIQLSSCKHFNYHQHIYSTNSYQVYNAWWKNSDFYHAQVGQVFTNYLLRFLVPMRPKLATVFVHFTTRNLQPLYK